MGGFGGGRDSGGGGNSNRERGAARNRKSASRSRSTPRSTTTNNNNTFYGKTDLGPNQNQHLMSKAEKKQDNLKYGFSRINEGLQAVDDYTTVGKIVEAVDRRATVGKTSEKQKGILRTDLRTGATYKNAPKYRPTTPDRDGPDRPQGIELAKASTTSATILGPADIQKEAANNVKGPITTEMSATSTALTGDQILLANKRKGRRSTNITAKKTLAKNYTLSTKSLLG